MHVMFRLRQVKIKCVASILAVRESPAYLLRIGVLPRVFEQSNALRSSAQELLRQSRSVRFEEYQLGIAEILLGA